MTTNERTAIVSHIAQLKLFHRDSHNVDDRRELRGEIAKLAASLTYVDPIGGASFVKFDTATMAYVTA